MQLSQPFPRALSLVRGGSFKMERVVGEDNKEDERLRAIVSSGVESGLVKLVTNKAFFLQVFAAFADAAQETAKKEAGSWLVGWIKWALGKAVLGGVILFVLWYTGGLPAVLAYMKVRS